MALIFTDSFDHYSTVTDKYDFQFNCTMGSSFVRSERVPSASLVSEIAILRQQRAVDRYW